MSRFHPSRHNEELNFYSLYKLINHALNANPTHQPNSDCPEGRNRNKFRPPDCAPMPFPSCDSASRAVLPGHHRHKRIASMWKILSRLFFTVNLFYTIYYVGKECKAPNARPARDTWGTLHRHPGQTLCVRAPGRCQESLLNESTVCAGIRG